MPWCNPSAAADVMAMNQGSIVLPTFAGHLQQAASLIASIRAHGSEGLAILLVLSDDAQMAFRDLAERYSCRILLIEDLTERYSGRRVSAGKLLRAVGKFRYQALKKLLGVCAAETELA